MLLGQTSSTNKQINATTQSITCHMTERTQWVAPSTQRKFFMLEEQRSRGAEEAAFGTFEASQRADWKGPASLKVLDHQKI